MPDKRFIWSPRDYELKEFADAYINSLPVIIEVTTGHHGLDNMHTFGSDELYFVNRTVSQKRVVCLDGINRRISFPINYPEGFFVLDTSKPLDEQMGLKRTQTLKEIIDNWDTVSDLHIHIDERNGVKFCIDMETEQTTNFGVLKVLDQYDEIYLIGNSIINDDFHIDPVIIPLYISIDLAVAIDVDKRYEKPIKMSFKELLKHYDEMTKNADLSHLKFNQDILELPAQEFGGIYETLEPQQIIKTYKQGKRANIPLDTSAPPLLPKVYPKINKKSKSLPSSSRLQPPPSPGKSKIVSLTRSVTNLTQKLWGAKPNKLPSRGNFYRPAPQPPIQEHSNDEGDNDFDQLYDDRSDVYDYPFLMAELGGMFTPSPRSEPSKPKVAVPAFLHDDQKDQGTNNNNDKEENPIYGELRQIPPDMTELSVTDVTRLLKLLNMESYIPTFEQNHIDGTLLMNMDEDILKEDFKFSKFHAKKLMQFINGWRPS